MAATARDRVNVPDATQEETREMEQQGVWGLTDVRREEGRLSCRDGPETRLPLGGNQGGQGQTWPGVVSHMRARTHAQMRMHIHVLRCTLTKRTHFPIS